MSSSPNRIDPRGSLLLGSALALLCAAAYGCAPGNENESGSSVDLASAVAACAGDLGTCAQETDGDVDPLAVCRAEFGACHDGAMLVSPPTGGSAHAVAVRVCVGTATGCLRVAGDVAGVLVCRDDLLGCLGDARPVPAVPADAAAPAGAPPTDPPPPPAAPPDEVPPPEADDHAVPTAPAGTCGAQYAACVAAGFSADDCARALRGCAD